MATVIQESFLSSDITPRVSLLTLLTCPGSSEGHIQPSTCRPHCILQTNLQLDTTPEGLRGGEGRERKGEEKKGLIHCSFFSRVTCSLICFCSFVCG